MQHLNVTMPDEVRDALKQFAEDQDIPEGEALTRAIALVALARKEKKENGLCLAFAEVQEGMLVAVAPIEGV